MNYALVTGSAGLIGSQSVSFLIEKGYIVVGIDNDMRSYFFGAEASTEKSKKSLINNYGKKYIHKNIDIRNYGDLEVIYNMFNFDIIIHTAAQPSHDWASKEPLTDFTINANGTLNLLELTRLKSPKATFIFTSTNKVYGDKPNTLPLVEDNSRYEYYDKQGKLSSIDETMSIDQSTHSIFGSSKLSADIMCQEYGRYFNMNVGIFRGGCLTGPNHAGTELHGFLSYLVKCIINDKPYTIFGYGGKQVRDNIHSWDLVNMFWHFHKNPKQGEVYNAGGGRDNSISILEAINKINKISGKKWDKFNISNDNRIGDHKWYISDLSKFKNDYPKWEIKYNITKTLKLMIENEKNNK